MLILQTLGRPLQFSVVLDCIWCIFLCMQISAWVSSLLGLRVSVRLESWHA
uniref:Uncharacterized protein n=1 Tax=Arundo donax TaxID=35708 RepID=A0A0A9G2U6_ARUDO